MQSAGPLTSIHASVACKTSHLCAAALLVVQRLQPTLLACKLAALGPLQRGAGYGSRMGFECGALSRVAGCGRSHILPKRDSPTILRKRGTIVPGRRQASVALACCARAAARRAPTSLASASFAAIWSCSCARSASQRSRVPAEVRMTALKPRGACMDRSSAAAMLVPLPVQPGAVHMPPSRLGRHAWGTELRPRLTSRTLSLDGASGGFVLGRKQTVGTHLGCWPACPPGLPRPALPTPSCAAPPPAPGPAPAPRSGGQEQAQRMGGHGQLTLGRRCLQIHLCVPCIGHLQPRHVARAQPQLC